MQVINVAASNGSEKEGGGEIVFFMDAPAQQDITVKYTIAGTAEQGIDYSPLPIVAVIRAGQLKAVLTIEPIDDKQLEGNETIIAYLLPSHDYKIGSQSAAVSQIIDNEFVRYSHRKMNGSVVQETTSVTINEMQARIIQIEINLNILIKKVSDLTN